MNNTVFKKVISLEEAKALLEQLRQSRGCPSGFPALDKLSGGLVQDGVTLVAGRPAMGRTACVMNMVGRLSRRQEGTILVFSPRFWVKELAMLLLGIVMETNPEEFFDSKLSPEEIVARFSDYYEAKKSNIKLDTISYLSLDEIWEKSCRIPDLQMIVINPIEGITEPLNLMENPVNWDKRREPPEKILKSLKELADTLNVPVVCTACLHRSLERRKNKRPRLGDLKKIGVPAELADQIIFLYRDRYYDSNGQEGAEWIVAKSPNGTVGTVELDWDDAARCFHEHQ